MKDSKCEGCGSISLCGGHGTTQTKRPNIITQWLKPHTLEERQVFGKHCGFMVAYKENDQVHIGFSFCNYRYDDFDPILAKKIAFGRAASNVTKTLDDIATSVPFKFMPEVEFFIDRAVRYFKCDNLPNWVKELQEYKD